MRVALLIVLSLVAPPLRLGAQSAGPGNDRFGWGEVFDADEAMLLGSVTASTLALSHVDSLLMARVQGHAAGERRFLDPLASTFDLVGRPGSFILAGGTFVVGGTIGDQALTDIGFRMGSALLLNEVVTRAIKGVVGRARPDTSASPASFAPGRGFGSHAFSSFPSGHASSAFVVAAVVQGELSHRASPAQVPVAIILYGAATSVALSRIYDNRHWVTDVVAGAALGYLIGENVVEYAHRPRAGEAEPPSPALARRSSRGFPAIPIFYGSIPTR